MGTDSSPARASMSLRRLSPATVLGLVVVLPTVLGIGFLSAQTVDPLPLRVVPWIVLVALVELLPVPTWAGVQVGLGFPLLIAVAFHFQPETAALVALIASADPREIRRQITPLRALFNRSQVSLAVLAASAIFHAFSGVDERLVDMLPAAFLATVADYVINVSIVTTGLTVLYRVTFNKALGQLLGSWQEFVVSYLGLGVVGTVLAKLYSVKGVGFWSVVIVIAPLLLARQMFFRSRALEKAHKEQHEREQVLRSLSNAMAEERHDERTQIAGYLHDDLAQIIFRLSIQVDVAEKLLEKGEIADTLEQLHKIRQSKQDTSDRVRALIRDLHRSPIGPKGLAEALESFTEEMGRDAPVAFKTHVEDIALPAPIALLVYHIAREGVMNALKHANASEVSITVAERDETIELELRDDGVGFDMFAPGPEGHFGMAMMRERAKVGGGIFDVDSAPGQGTTITVRFPTSLLSEESASQEPSRASDPSGVEPVRASPGTSSPSGQADEGSPQTVRA